jgi:hypothetical protein
MWRNRWLWRRSLYVRVTESLVRGLRRLTGQRFPRFSGNRGWGNLTKEDLSRQGITPGMPGMPHGGPPPRAVAMPPTKASKGINDDEGTNAHLSFGLPECPSRWPPVTGKDAHDMLCPA